ncbi:response regulator transcription factor [Oryzibacter oryziterrae]|uniref:response regulator transcription factor n=1 Tax=Oryzibacter oryziterrae TaxID=2766474 RepID=UPI001F2B44C1|nr:response regulator transcription factor [Oryzibacter oryziterrae]
MKILVVDDHAVVREGASRLLATLAPDEIAEAETPEEGFRRFVEMRPDVTVLDINLRGGSGLDLLRRIRGEDAGARVVIFSMYSDVVYANSARRAGAIGYVSKSASSDDLLTAVRLASAGQSFVDEELAAMLDSDMRPDQDPFQSLARREIEVLRLLGDGLGLNEISEQLGIAYKTVANTCTRIKEKLGLERTGDLIRYAVENRHNRLSERNLDM